MTQPTMLFDEVLRCRKFIEAALEYSGGTHKFDDIVAGIFSQKMQLWGNKNSAVVTEIVVYPQLKSLNYFLAGGDLDELKQMRPHIEAWAAGLGCTKVTLSGRPGWAKTFLKDEGYKPTWFVMSKDLKAGG